MNKPEDLRTERFVTDLAASQNRLYAYIFSLLADHNRAADVLQETNVVLWRRLEEFDPERPFLAWAMGVARIQVMAHFRDAGRDRLLLDETLVSQVADDLSEQNGSAERDGSMAAGLQRCLGSLAEEQRSLVKQRYFQSKSIRMLASKHGRSEGAIKLMLFRIRRALADCIERQELSGETTAENLS